MKKILCAFLMTLFCQQAFAAFYPDSSLDPLVGWYNVTGKNSQDTYAPSYTGTAYIEKCGQNYNIEWHIGNKVFAGFGVKYGDCIAFSYVSNTSNRLAVAIYKVDIRGNLDGHWAFDDSTTFKIEKLEPCQ